MCLVAAVMRGELVLTSCAAAAVDARESRRGSVVNGVEEGRSGRSRAVIG